jgi:YYY domain-containing protein
VLVAPVLWLLALELVGLAALPLTHHLFHALPDRGYGSSKFLGLILVAYVAWVTAILGITGFTGPTIVVLTALLGGVSWWRWGHLVRASWRELRPFAIAAEVVFVGLYLLAVWIRAYNAPIAGQEKQMDLTFLHSLIQSSSLPAQDLWMAGFGMPYYYLGYLTHALVAKATGTDPIIAYNLAMAAVLALSSVGAFGLVASIVRLGGAPVRVAIGVGVVAPYTLMLMGNLEALFRWLSSQGIGDSLFYRALGVKNLTRAGQGFPEGDWSWFNAARVIPNIQPDGITEFPFFSFILGDLHPHYMAIPLGILIVTLGAQQLAGRTWNGRDLGRVLATAVVLGAVILSNTWDVPVFWGLFGLALFASTLSRVAFSVAELRRTAQDLGMLVLIAVAMYSPYFVGYVSQRLGLGLNWGPGTERTMFGSLFVLFGPLVVLAFAAAAVEVVRGSLSRDEDRLPRPIAMVAAAGAVVGLILMAPAVFSRFGEASDGTSLAWNEPTLGFLVSCLAMWLALLWHRVRAGDSPSGIATALITIVGLGSILVPELIFLRDSFGTRMNTVFKFYYDAWILLALAAPLLGWELYLALRGLRAATVEPELHPHALTDFDPIPEMAPPVATPVPSWSPAWLRGASGAALALALVLTMGGVIYPLAATNIKSDRFRGQPTLDGMVHLRNGRPEDAAVIDWLRRNYPGSGVVEMVGNDYSDAARFSTFAGTPTLMGWIGHQLQWRGQIPELDRRKALADRVYTDLDTSSWRNEVRALGMEFVVVGSMERERFGPDVASRLERDLPVVFRSGNAMVFALNPMPAPSVAGQSTDSGPRG